MSSYRRNYAGYAPVMPASNGGQESGGIVKRLLPLLAVLLLIGGLAWRESMWSQALRDQQLACDHRIERDNKAWSQKADGRVQKLRTKLKQTIELMKQQKQKHEEELAAAEQRAHEAAQPQAEEAPQEAEEQPPAEEAPAEEEAPPPEETAGEEQPPAEEAPAEEEGEQPAEPAGEGQPEEEAPPAAEPVAEEEQQPPAASTSPSAPAKPKPSRSRAPSPTVISVPRAAHPPRQFTVPPEVLPDDLQPEFTLNGKIPYYTGFYSNDQTAPGGEVKVVNYAKSRIDALMQDAKAGKQQYYGDVDTRLYNILKRHPGLIKGKDVVILGSLEPWYEAVVLAYGAGSVTTIEYGPRTTDDERLNIVTPAQFAANPRTFDVALSISSFEHDGLGRYGDPVSAVGDLRAMAETAALLKPGGHLLLAVPRGSDAIVGNHHRIYGPIRWPMLTAGWVEEDADGPLEEIKVLTGTSEAQPVYLLTPYATFTDYERT